MKSIVVDLGGTRIKIGLVLDGELVDKEIIPSYSDDGFLPRLYTIEQIINRILRETRTDISELSGIGISIPGIVDSKANKVLAINEKFNDIICFDFNEWVGKRWGISCVLENDARAALIGEWQYGTGKACDNIVLITLGTGIGGAALIDGKLLNGRHYQAGCLGGHFVVNLQGGKCTCGNFGCAESEASSWKLPELYRNHPNFKQSLAFEKKLLDFKLMFDLVAQEDTVSEEILNHCLETWSAVAITMIHAYDPEKVIFGGGVMKSKDRILPFIQNRVNERAWTPWGKVKVEAAHFGDEAGMLGMAYLCSEKIKNDE
jgi:glucokinase